MNLSKSYTVNKKIAITLTVIVVMTVIGYGLYTGIMLAAKWVTAQYQPF